MHNDKLLCVAVLYTLINLRRMALYFMKFPVNPGKKARPLITMGEQTKRLGAHFPAD